MGAKWSRDATTYLMRLISLNVMFGFFYFLYMHFVQGRWQPTQSQLIQIYSVDWRDVYDTHNIEHRT